MEFGNNQSFHNFEQDDLTLTRRVTPKFEYSPRENHNPSTFRGLNALVTPTRKSLYNASFDVRTAQSFGLHASGVHHAKEQSFSNDNYSHNAEITPLQGNSTFEKPLRNPSSFPKRNLFINLEGTDSDFDEFHEVHEGAKTISHFQKSKDGMIPKSPFVKTLTEINEHGGSRTPSQSFSACHDDFSKSKQINFPEEILFSNTGSNVLSHYWEGVQRKRSYHGARPSLRSDKSKRIILNVNILSNLLTYLNCGDIYNLKDLIMEFRKQKQYKKLFKERIFASILKGLNSSEQYHLWNAFVGFKNIKEKNPLTFTSQFVKGCPYLKEIMKDLDRTFPEYDKFSSPEGKDALLKVLVAVSNSMKDVGYIQGLNSIAGVFLFSLKEEESFWMLIYMLEKLKLKEVFKDDFCQVHILNYQLQVFLEYYLPEVAHFFERDDVENISYFTTPWFVTFFSYVLTLSNVLKAWNILFIKGYSFFIQLSLALFSIYKKKIVNMDVDHIGQFFKYELQEIAEKDKFIFEEALRFSVPNRIMQELEALYRQGKPQVKLVLDLNQKLQIQLSPTINPRQLLMQKSKISCSHRRTLREENEFDPLNNSTEVGKNLVQNIVNKFTVGFPEAIKTIFSKSPSKNGSPTKSLLSSELLDSPPLRKSDCYSASPDECLSATSLGRPRFKTDTHMRTELNIRPVISVPVARETEEISSPVLNVDSRKIPRESTLETDSQESGSGDFHRLRIPSDSKLENSPIQENCLKNSFLFRPQMKLNTEPLTPNHALKSKTMENFDDLKITNPLVHSSRNRLGMF